MIYKGKVTSINSEKNTVRVYISELNYISNELPLAKHISSVKINDIVLASFIGNSMENGVITSKMTGESDIGSLPDIIDGGSFV